MNKSLIFLPPFHIKLGLFKQFMKALDKKFSAFAYLAEKFLLRQKYLRYTCFV